jgi:tRNA/tmRNA/rRNA uracil-C5-methylase (TrmA/RlmC/RlmD family)
MQALVQLAEAAGLPRPPFHTSPGAGHRHRARLAVRGRARSPKIGLFQAGSHRIVDTPHCAVHHPRINETARALREAIRATGIEPYADKPHRGQLRYVQIVVERSTQRVQVVLVGNGEGPEILGDLPEVFAERLGDRLQGLFFNAQPLRSNAVLGPRMLKLRGEDAVREEINGTTVFFPPGAFGQNHLPLFEQAVRRIAQLVPENGSIAEYYCGVGSIGLPLIGRARSIVFNERSPDGIRGLELGLAALPESLRPRASVRVGAAGEQLEALTGADLVLVDPPRKGLDVPLREALIDTPPKRLIYLACGLGRLLEDLEALTGSGRLNLRGIEAFDFFPFTEHVETLVWLDRNGEDFAHGAV